MSDPTANLPEVVWAAMVKLWPGVAGSVFALRWLPAQSTYLDRLTAFLGGVASVAFVAPAIVELSSVTSTSVEYAIIFFVGLFAMAVIGELMATVREVGLPAMLRDALRRVLRLEDRR